ncbi:peptidoglycan-binding protein [Alkalicoccus daliensis]|uniref:Beta-N-acetylglucosaminidase n=1 Tax=Alkalicoccus daliensis TaxID=745820 RepID=A0A1H0GHW0_9BACI|nr:peptidoglycan-binding protein [Alkalicoccus daliensis]SDO06480.1 Beta-N-acetylglucosaminidase [Alkalicoccus daliensis]
MNISLKKYTSLCLVLLLVFSSFGTAFAEELSEEESNIEVYNERTDDSFDELTEEQLEDLHWQILKEHLTLYYEVETESEEEFEKNLLNYLHEFQIEYDLEVTPTYSEETVEKMVEVLRDKGYYYIFGMEHEEVILVKEKLKNNVDPEMFTGENITPFYGAITKELVEKFQEEHELKVHGAIDEKTAEMLQIEIPENTEETEQNEANESSSEEFEEELPVTEESSDEVTENTVAKEETNSEENKDLNSEETDNEEEKKKQNSVENETAPTNEAEEKDQNEIAEEELQNERENTSDGSETNEENLQQEKQENVNEQEENAHEEKEAEEDIVQSSNETEREEENSSQEINTFSSMAVQSTALALPFKDGDSGIEIKEMKMKLTALGFGNFPSDPSTVYGPVTEGVVKDFQAYYGLNADGIADEPTMSRLSNELGTPYQSGNASEQVREMKMKLTDLGYGNFPSDPSTVYGSVTKSVVEEFQQANNLIANGIGDSKTIGLLQSLHEDAFSTASLSLPFQNGDRGEEITLFKQNLTTLGFGSFPENPSTVYGPVTMGVVKQFQAYFGLTADGVTNQQTYNRVASELETIYQPGSSHSSIVGFKQDLTALGFGNFPETPSGAYGTVTASVVKDFQKAEDLVESGIADSVTLNRIKELKEELISSRLSLPYKNGDSGEEIVKLKQDLTTLGFGSFPENPSTLYGSVTRGVVNDFQTYFGLTTSQNVDKRTLDRIQKELNSPFRSGQPSSDAIKELKENLTSLGFGSFPENPSRVYGSVTASVVADFQKANNLRVNGIGDSVTMKLIDSQTAQRSVIAQGKVTASNLNVRSTRSTGSSSTVYGTLPNGTIVDILVDHGTWYEISHASISQSPAYVSASFIEVQGAGVAFPYERGDSGDEIRVMKQGLTKLGFGSFPSNPSGVYGSVTEKVVKEFQEYYGLNPTGKMSKTNLEYLESILSSHYVSGQSHANVKELKINLTKLGFGSFPSNPSTAYGSVTASVVKSFQKHHGLVENGIGDPVTMQKINTELNKIGNNIQYRTYQITLNQMLERQMMFAPQASAAGGGWRNATSVEVARWLDPNNFTADPNSRDMYQFLVLSQTSGVSASQLNNILRNRGVLHGTGATFKSAAETQGVNDIYLISHAILETGHGTSILSNGSIEVGEISTNRWVSIQPLSNGSKATYILEYRPSTNSWHRTRNDSFNTNNITLRKTYNMFGIEAVDSDPHTRGSVRAFREGWFTPEDSIRGGAQFISNSYLDRGQDTLYKMRWDPDFHEASMNSSVTIPRTRFYQYATDIGWAYKQTDMIKTLYDQIDNPYLPFEVPSYQ